MNDISTMIVSELDDERTLVDPRFARRRASRATTETPDGRGAPLEPQTAQLAQAPPAVKLKRRAFERFVPIFVMLGLALIAYQQWDIANALRESAEVIAASTRSLPVSEISEQAPPVQPSTVSAVASEDVTLRPPAFDRELMERQAVSAFASNDFPAALARYRALFQHFPEFSPYRDAVAVLRGNVGCDLGAGTTPGACR